MPTKAKIIIVHSLEVSKKEVITLATTTINNKNKQQPQPQQPLKQQIVKEKTAQPFFLAGHRLKDVDLY